MNDPTLVKVRIHWTLQQSRQRISPLQSYSIQKGHIGRSVKRIERHFGHHWFMSVRSSTFDWKAVAILLLWNVKSRMKIQTRSHWFIPFCSSHYRRILAALLRRGRLDWCKKRLIRRRQHENYSLLCFGRWKQKVLDKLTILFLLLLAEKSSYLNELISEDGAGSTSCQARFMKWKNLKLKSCSC